MIYIVIKNEQYYPASGTYDWVLCTTDPSEAQDCKDKLVAEGSPEYWITVVQIGSDGRYGEVQA